MSYRSTSASTPTTRRPRATRSTGRRCSRTRTSTSSRKFGLDEGQSSLTILGAVALMRVGVVAVAAVWVCGIAVRLDF